MGPVIGIVGALASVIGGATAAAGPLVLSGGALYGGFGGALAAGATFEATFATGGILGVLGGVLGGGGILGSLGEAIIGVGLSIGANLILRSLIKTPSVDLTLSPAGVGSGSSISVGGGGGVATPQAVQSVFKQSIGPRTEHYGRVKVGGQLAFIESKDGTLYSVVCTSAREISAFVEHWLNDATVTLDGSGNVTDAQYQYGGSSRAKVLPQLGTAAQAAHSELVAAFPTLWASTAKGTGIANVLTIFSDLPSEGYRQVYPQGAPTYRSVIDAAKVFDPRDVAQSSGDASTWVHSRNPALCILDYLTYEDGLGRPRALFDEDSFAAAADVCDEDVSLKGGGTEKRYALSGSFDLTERPVDVLTRMLSACDGELFPQADGTWGLRVGKWYAPSQTLDDAAGEIISYQMQEYADALSGFNLVKPVYVSASHDYQETQAEEWIDSGLYAIYGEYRVNDLRLPMVPSPSQARRLSKIVVAKGNARWSGTITTTLAGLKVIDQANFTLKLTELDINETFKVVGFRIAGDLTTCEIDVISLSSATYDWDPATEEGTAPPVPPDSPAAQPPPTPTGLAVSRTYVTLQSLSQAAVLNLSWDTAPRDSLATELNYKLSTDSEWQSIRVPAGTTTYTTAPVGTGKTYNVRIRALSLGGTPSDWSSTVSIAVADDATAPGAPSAFQLAALSSGGALLNWLNPANSNFSYVKVYYNLTHNDFNDGGTSAILTIYGPPAANQAYIYQAASSGYYWLRSFNTTNVAGGVTDGVGFGV